MNRRHNLLARFTRAQNASVLIALGLLLTLVTLLNGQRFWKIGNLVTVASNASIVGILACGMTLVILLGGIDLSVAANASFASIVMGYFYINQGWPAWAALLTGAAGALAVGAVNGYIIAVVRLNPMITTLSTQLIVRALCYTSTNAVSLEVGGVFFKAVGRTQVFGILPIYVLYFLAVFVVFSYLVSCTPYGRRVYAVGGNESATYLSGINVKRTKVITYALCGLLAGIAGIANALSVSYANPQAMTGREFEVIASVVLGGVSLSGGKGSMLGTFLGVLVMTVINNMLILIGIQSYWQSFAQGIILLAAVYIDSLRTRAHR